MKKKMIFGLLPLLGVAAFGLASCDSKQVVAEDDVDDFGVNDDPTVEPVTMYIVGSNWNSWTPATIVEASPSCTFVLDTNSTGLQTKYTYTVNVTAEMAEGYVGFKFIGGASWTSQFGMEDIDFTKSNQAFIDAIGDKNEDGVADKNDKYFYHEGTSNRTNVEPKVAGTYVIDYYPYNFETETKNDVPYSSKFVVTFTAA